MTPSCHICQKSFDLVEDGWSWVWSRRKPGPVKYQCPDHVLPKYIQLTLW